MEPVVVIFYGRKAMNALLGSVLNPKKSVPVGVTQRLQVKQPRVLVIK